MAPVEGSTGLAVLSRCRGCSAWGRQSVRDERGRWIYIRCPQCHGYAFTCDRCGAPLDRHATECPTWAELPSELRVPNPAPVPLVATTAVGPVWESAWRAPDEFDSPLSALAAEIASVDTDRRAARGRSDPRASEGRVDPVQLRLWEQPLAPTAQTWTTRRSRLKWT